MIRSLKTLAAALLAPLAILLAIASPAGATQVQIDPARNLTSQVGSRFIAPVLGTIPNTTSAYGITNIDVGGLITIATGLPAGTVLNSVIIRVKVRGSDVTTNPTIGMMFFEANPTSSTFTDGQAWAIAEVDSAKAVSATSPTGTMTGQVGGIYEYLFTGARATVDANGNLYFVLCTVTAGQWTAGSVIGYRFEATY